MDTERPPVGSVWRHIWSHGDRYVIRPEADDFPGLVAADRHTGVLGIAGASKVGERVQLRPDDFGDKLLAA